MGRKRWAHTWSFGVPGRVHLQRMSRSGYVVQIYAIRVFVKREGGSSAATKQAIQARKSRDGGADARAAGFCSSLE